MKTITVLLCKNPTKTLTKDKTYTGIPVKKDEHPFYNTQYGRQWEECKLEQCTSFKISDDIGITRYISKKRFKVV